MDTASLRALVEQLADYLNLVHGVLTDIADELAKEESVSGVDEKMSWIKDHSVYWDAVLDNQNARAHFKEHEWVLDFAIDVLKKGGSYD